MRNIRMISIKHLSNTVLTKDPPRSVLKWVKSIIFVNSDLPRINETTHSQNLQNQRKYLNANQNLRSMTILTRPKLPPIVTCNPNILTTQQTKHLIFADRKTKKSNFWEKSSSWKKNDSNCSKIRLMSKD